MTETLNSIEWFANYKKFDFKEVTIGGVYFNYIALTDEMIESVKSCVSVEAMQSMAADYGMSNKRTRITDDEEDANNIEDFWLSPLLSIEIEPTIKQQLGDLVCQASGMTQFIQDKLEDEMNEKIEADAIAKKAEEDKTVFELGENEVAGGTALEDLPEITAEELNQHADEYVMAG